MLGLISIGPPGLSRPTPLLGSIRGRLIFED